MIYLVNKITKEHRRYEDAIDWRDSDCRLVQADADGWIPWEGGECPLPDDARAKLRTRNGVEHRLPIHAGNQRWGRGGGQYDIIAYRPILDADTKPEAPEWDGEGLPPVGRECEVMHYEKWRRCEIIAHFNQRAGTVAAFTIDAGGGLKMLDAFVADCFRPIRSEEDRAVEEMVKSVCGSGDYTESLCRALYHSGYRKTTTDGEGEA